VKQKDEMKMVNRMDKRKTCLEWINFKFVSTFINLFCSLFWIVIFISTKFQIKKIKKNWNSPKKKETRRNIGENRPKWTHADGMKYRIDGKDIKYVLYLY
jgi:hypothetical protein